MKKAEIFYGTEWENLDSTDTKFDFLFDRKVIHFPIKIIPDNLSLYHHHFHYQSILSSFEFGL